jgi:hypothetical protein
MRAIFVSTDGIQLRPETVDHIMARVQPLRDDDAPGSIVIDPYGQGDVAMACLISNTAYLGNVDFTHRNCSFLGFTFAVSLS